MRKTEFTEYQRMAFASEAHFKSAGERMKMEAMTEDDIKRYLVEVVENDDTWQDDHDHCVDIERRFILTWATAKAEVERLSFWAYHDRQGTEPEGCPECDQADDKRDVRKRHLWKNEDWLNSVLFRIGWPKEA